jgi:hypothetical protein
MLTAMTSDRSFIVTLIAFTTYHAGYLHYFWIRDLALCHHVTLPDSLHNPDRQGTLVGFQSTIAVLA